MLDPPTGTPPMLKDKQHGRNQLQGLVRAMAQALWAAVSTLLFMILRQEEVVATIICAISLQCCETSGFAFVDDTDLIVTDPSNNEQKVVGKMQDSLTLWHGLLKAMGGDLVPEKCFWYLIDFTHDGNQWRYKQWNTAQRQLQITKDNRTKVVIPRLQTNEAR